MATAADSTRTFWTTRNRQGRHDNNTRMRLYPDAAEAFFTSVPLTEGSRRTYSYVYRQLQERHPRLTLASATSAVLDDFLSRDSHGQARDLAPRTQANYVNALRALFNWAVEGGHIMRSPADGITERGSKQAMREPIWLTLDQLKELASFPGDTATDVRDRLILARIGIRGGRPAVLAKLRWRKIDSVIGFASRLADQRKEEWRQVFLAVAGSEARMANMPVVCPIQRGEVRVGVALGQASIRQIIAQRVEEVCGIPGVVPEDLRRSMVGGLWAMRCVVVDLATTLGLDSPESVYRMVREYPWPPPSGTLAAPF